MIDVGTDHGMIPIRLAQSDYTGNIFASDIVSGPLNVAMKLHVHARRSTGSVFFYVTGSIFARLRKSTVS